MKTPLFKLLILVVLIPVLGFTTTHLKAKYEKSATFKKTFNVDANTLLKIKNKYGNVDIATWDKNIISIEVIITVKGSNENKVERKLNNIYVEFNQISNTVSAKTVIEKSYRNWGWWGSNNRLNYSINYTVKMPVSNSLNLTNDYGAISLDKLNGAAKINCDYGSFNIGELNNIDNQINADYLSTSNIGFINNAVINADYSKLNIDKANKINLNADYTTTQIGDIKNLEYSCDYGSLKVDKVNSLNGSGDYISLRIGTLSKLLDIKADYGSFKVNNILNGFTSIKVNTDYTSGMRFGFEKNNNFNFTIDMEYARFRYEDINLEFNKKIIKSSSKYYEGYYGKSNSGSTVNINVAYGSVSFYNN